MLGVGPDDLRLRFDCTSAFLLRLCKLCVTVTEFTCVLVLRHIKCALEDRLCNSFDCTVKLYGSCLIIGSFLKQGLCIIKKVL